jgi:hypothetical protein
LRNLTFLDPACGCGNFLVIAYRELRLLELAILKQLIRSDQLVLDVSQLILLNVDQFYGIEIEEFPSQIAQVALWLIDHQMNLLISEEFGQYFARIPLQASSTILNDNALRCEWESMLPSGQFTFIMGNPPFVGAKFLSVEQKADVSQVFAGIRNAGLLDYVAAWYVKALKLISGNNGRCAFVSTNSICQGEQVGVLWSWVLEQGISIFFAHRTFCWINEARGVAAVHCIIVGLSSSDLTPKWLFSYDDIKGDPLCSRASNINPYLVDAANRLLPSRRRPLAASTPPMCFGSMANDGGHLLMEEVEYKQAIARHPEIAEYLRPFLQVNEFLYSEKRYALWLVDASPDVLNHPFVRGKIERVRDYRAQSKRPTTRSLASTPSLFGEIRQPHCDYLLVPRHTSELRRYIPLGFFDNSVICGDANMLVAGATMYEFGVLSSRMHTCWLAYVGGRIKSDFRYSAKIVYNNYPWPVSPSGTQSEAIIAAARVVMEVRQLYPNACLAKLYDHLSMPPALARAHQQLDRVVEKAYGNVSFESDGARVSYLFQLHEKYSV